jgi:hypothetical protein
VRECVAKHEEKAPMSGIIGWSPEFRQTRFERTSNKTNASVNRL